MGPTRNLPNMDCARRRFLANIGVACLLAPALAREAWGQVTPIAGAAEPVFDVRAFGAIGDGKSIDSPAINQAIRTASVKGGVVYFPAGTYACYSLRLASSIVLAFDTGATILAADTSREGTVSGYDTAESNAPWEAFQDFGHTGTTA
jgi:polygalacturonase